MNIVKPTEKACSKCKVVKPIACYQWQEKRQSHRAACIECNRDAHAKRRRSRGQKQKLPQSHYLDISIKNGINPLSDRRILGELCSALHKWNGLDYSLKDYNSRGQIDGCVECKRLRMKEYSQRPEVKQRMREYEEEYRNKAGLSRWLEFPKPLLTPAELCAKEQVRWNDFVMRFWDKVQVGKADECWEWTRAKDKDGYGTTSDRDGWQAHRVAYLTCKGAIPPKMLVCHHCDNPACCNPSHLFLGTNKDNTQDMMRKGRWSNGGHRGIRVSAIL